VENPVYWNSPQQFLVASTPSRALGLSPVFRAVTLISNDVARTEADFDSFPLQKLWSRPNQFTSGYDFRRALTAQCLMYGNGFALINRRGNGQVHELVALTPGTVSIVTSQNSTDPLYKTEFGLVTPDDIIHLKATLTEGLLAHSPINLCKVELATPLGTGDEPIECHGIGCKHSQSCIRFSIANPCFSTTGDSV